MKEIAVTVNGTRYKAKKLDEAFAEFVEEDLRTSGILLDRDNDAERLFVAYLRLASRWYHYEKEIDEILETIEKD